MEFRRGVKGETGLQGPPGPPCKTCSQNHLPQPVTTRYISSGGKRSLHPTDSVVILDSEEKVVLLLPVIQTTSEFFEDQYYYPCNITIKCLGDSHLVKSPDKKINNLSNTVILSKWEKYEFTSTPKGWLMLVFTSKTD